MASAVAAIVVSGTAATRPIQPQIAATRSDATVSRLTASPNVTLWLLKVNKKGSVHCPRAE